MKVVINAETITQRQGSSQDLQDIRELEIMDDSDGGDDDNEDDDNNGDDDNGDGGAEVARGGIEETPRVPPTKKVRRRIF